MNLMKRAWLYVTRQKLRTFILFLILLVMTTFLLMGLAIQESAQTATGNIRSTTGGKVILEYDWSSATTTEESNASGGYDSVYAGDLFTQEVIEELLSIEGVVAYHANFVTFSGKPVNFNVLPAGFDFGDENYGTVTPVSGSERYDSFTKGTIHLEEGRHITPDDRFVVLISEELALFNGISLGDPLRIDNPFSEIKPVEVEVIGIYTGTEGIGQDAMMSEFRPGNQIISDAYTSLAFFDDQEEKKQTLSHLLNFISMRLANFHLSLKK